MHKSTMYLRAGAASPDLIVADPRHNAIETARLAKQAAAEGVQILAFPELGLTAYTAADLLYQDRLLDEAEEALGWLAGQSLDWGSLVIAVGAPVRYENNLYNCAVLIQAGRILGAVPKLNLPTTREFYEARWFASGFDLPSDVVSIRLADHDVFLGRQLFSLELNGRSILLGVEICEDLWVPVPPSSEMAVDGASVILNLSASNELVGKNSYRRRLISQQSASLNAAYIYADAGAGESSTDLVFAGHSLITENGKLLAESELFVPGQESLITADLDLGLLLAERRQNRGFTRDSGSRLTFIRTRVPEFLQTVDWPDLRRQVNPHPFVPSDPVTLDERCRMVTRLQAGGLMKRFLHTKSKHAVIGISGGLDSTLALLVVAEAFEQLGRPASDIIGITMPGFGTTDRTYQNALDLMKELGITMREISIVPSVLRHFEDIGHNPNQHDTTYENSQARERTQILMDVANQVGGLVIGTGDLSELAIGWCTYNGDHMSMYGVNSSVPKTLVKYLVGWHAKQARGRGDEQTAKLLEAIVGTPISPELLPPDEDGNILQQTEETTGPYELHDFFLYHMLRFAKSPSDLFHLARHAFADREEYTEEVVLKWLREFIRRFFNSQFKRSCLPDGPKVGTISLSPRGDWRMPSDASAAAWLRELEDLENH